MILNFSELFYLHADKFVPSAGFLQNKEELPSGKKLNITKLGNLLSEAAFAYLYFNGYIDLKLETKKTLGIFSKKIVVASKKSRGENLSSLEKAIFDLSNNLDTYSIIYKVIGDECTVPWAIITKIVKDSLVDKGYLTKETIVKKIIVNFYNYKYHLNPDKKVEFTNEVSEMEQKLKEFSKLNFYKDLVKAIESGIKAQVEKSDNDFGSD